MIYVKFSSRRSHAKWLQAVINQELAKFHAGFVGDVDTLAYRDAFWAVVTRVGEMEQRSGASLTVYYPHPATSPFPYVEIAFNRCLMPRYDQFD